MADDPRQRRLLRLKEEQRKERPKVLAKQVGIGALLVLGVGGVGALIFIGGTPDTDCPGHWHATMGIFVDGDRVPIPQPPYNFENEGGVLPLSLHMHSPNQEQIHFEPPRRTCRGVDFTLDNFDVDASSSSLTLGGAHEDGTFGGTYREDGNRTLHFFIHHPDDAEMREETWAAIDDYQLKDGEKLLIAYGNYTDEELTTMMAGINWPSGAVPQHPEG